MRKTPSYMKSNRDGAIIPMFAILLPVLLVLAAFSVNLASMQLTTTELRIASDVTSHAGGRALNVFQNMDNPNADRVIDRLQETVERYYSMNTVAGQTLTPPSDPSSYIKFYNLGVRRDRLEDSFYEENIVSESAARGGASFNGVGVQANVETDFAFDFRYGGGSLGAFAPTRNSVTKQVERDLSVVIDRSGSMLHYRDNQLLEEVLDDMRNQSYITVSEYQIALGFKEARKTTGGTAYFSGNFNNPSLYRRRYSIPFTHWVFFNNQWNEIPELDVIGEMQAFANANPGDPRDIDAMIKYMKSWEGVAPYNGNRKTPFVHNDWRNAGMFNDHAPAESRWDYLFRGMQDFVDVLESTPAEEKISLVVFNNGAEARSSLTLNYQAVLDEVEGIIPDNGTAIHLGLGQGLAKVLEEDNSRPFTEKFIVVMTDGENNNINGVPGSGDAAVLQAANDVLVDAEAAGKEVTIHTLTFGDGSGISANPDFPHASAQPWEGVMVDVAVISGGEHFHAEEAEELQLKLKEIANIQPTIFTF